MGSYPDAVSVTIMYFCLVYSFHSSIAFLEGHNYSFQFFILQAMPPRIRGMLLCDE
jgi:hypothetical protein